ncbi:MULTISPECIES: DUF4249 domain-containing protein [unclassified Lentimicrobium]|uniref:DUF4249 domain-containing protein n=1 Tax=unclassified Lentimicrobium TaxID=2677434 RepID=UPI0015574020|nr:MULTISPECIES: DUF4249 domain-containing protein [unclassified Lentimicrobium]NPD44628.1 DUF4249 domain-containing protein [Lentimicrobium sp. S6]NPD83340.1 DUF4249 domain-containing protein [Lentimicrobium sp. L6]
MFIILTSCIKKYDPNFKDNALQKYVVQGTVNNQEGWQEIDISISSALTQPAYIPVGGCQVEIIDDENQKFDMEEYEKGKYRVWMSQEYLVVGRAYKTRIVLPNEDILESSFDQMPSGPEIEGVFFQLKDLPTSEPDEWIKGIQYYTHLKASSQQSRFYRWQITETWEFHSAYPKEFYYDGVVNHIFPPDYSEFYCWTTRVVDEIFTLSTQSLSENEYSNLPLHYVSNTSERLSVLYSFMLKQIALSEAAYQYWDQLRINNTIGEGLYASQPLAIKGNIVNTTNPHLEVLGFFQASSETSKRIFTEPLNDLELDYSNKCSPALMRKGLIEITPNMYPAWLMEDRGVWIPVLMNDECVDCTLRGGKTEKPIFWP